MTVRSSKRTSKRRGPRHGRVLPALLAALLVAAHCPLARAGDTVETSGDVVALALPLTAVVMTYRRHDPPGRREEFRAFAANLIATFALKGAINKERPDGSGNDAFPSGHAAVSFQSAAFIQRRYGSKSAWPAYLAAAYVAWTRVDAKKHDTADVVGGAALGIASSMWLVKRSPRVAFTPVVGPDLIGIRLAGAF